MTDSKLAQGVISSDICIPLISQKPCVEVAARDFDYSFINHSFNRPVFFDWHITDSKLSL